MCVAAKKTYEVVCAGTGVGEKPQTVIVSVPRSKDPQQLSQAVGDREIVVAQEISPAS